MLPLFMPHSAFTLTLVNSWSHYTLSFQESSTVLRSTAKPRQQAKTLSFYELPAINQNQIRAWYLNVLYP
jgi:hypothetical protein